MTDRDDQNDQDDQDVPAMDLSALDPLRDHRLADRVIARTMTRIAASAPSASPSRDSVLADVAQWWRPGLAAAAVIAVVAGGSALVVTPSRTDRSTTETIESQLLAWSRTGHVPSNAELFSVFRAGAP